MGSRAARFVAKWRSPSGRMALMTAARGTVALMVPLLALQFVGEPAGAVMAAFGGMNTVMVDVGGAYRKRMLVMLLLTVLGSISLFLGCQMHGSVWLAALVLLAITFTTGMARVFGQPGISLGINISIMFLVGALAPQGLDAGLHLAGFYVIGGLWAILFTLSLWRLRPYRRLFQQIAACYAACADLVTTLSGSHGTQLRGNLRKTHRTLHEAIQQAEDVLETWRTGAGHSNPVFDRSVELLRAVSREGAAAVNLRLIAASTHGAVAPLWQAAMQSWQEALRMTAEVLLTWKGRVPVAEMRAHFAAVERLPQITSAAHAPLQLAQAHMQEASDALDRLTGTRVAFRDWVPRIGLGSLRHVGTTFVAQLSFRSFIFRHALRVAVAASVAQWLAGELGLTHRLWMPMTVILVLQPEFGATWKRMLQRVGGTLAGVLIAGVLHFLLHGSMAESAVIAVCAFGTFLFIRTHYGVGVTMLTPMVLLLLGVLVPRSGVLILARGTDTLMGAALALAAAFVLWPAWQKGAFREQCHKALVANREFLAAVLEAARGGHTVYPEVMRARQRAERETDNADAIFQRMLAEPAHTRAAMRPALGFTTYLRRFTEHTLALAVALEGRSLSPAAETAGRELLAQLGNVDSLGEGGALKRRSTTESVDLDKVAKETPPLNAWFVRLASDTVALRTLAARLARASRVSPEASKPPV